MLWYPDFISFANKSNRGIVGSYGSSLFNFLRKHYNIFHNGYTSLHSTNSVQGFSFPHQHLLYFDFLKIANLTGVWCYLVIFIYISLMINNVEHLFIYPLASHMSSLGKCLLDLFFNYFLRWFFPPIEMYEFLVYSGY